MGLFSKKLKVVPVQMEQRSSGFDYLLFGSNILTATPNKALLLSAVYRCVEVISDSIAQLPLEPYKVDALGYRSKFVQHPTYRILNSEPNKRMTRFTFLKTLVTSVLLKGNGYAYIQRNLAGDAIALHFIPSEYVTIIEPRTYEENITYSVKGIKGIVEACNMIHILNFSNDGITGISTLKYARNTLELANNAEAHSAGFFKGGANLAGILKVESSLTTKQLQDLKNSWNLAFSPETGNPNGIAVLQGNMTYEPITVNPEDSQLLETREFNVVDICRFFGVSPVKAFDLSHSSYSTVEATNLSFLTDTLSPMLEKIELEFERKLYKPSERDSILVRFDTSRLLRTDKESLANYYNTLFNIGVVSVNEIRKEFDLPAVDGGDNHFCQVNLMTLKNASNNVATDNRIENEEIVKQEDVTNTEV